MVSGAVEARGVVLLCAASAGLAAGLCVLGLLLACSTRASVHHDLTSAHRRLPSAVSA